MLAPRRAIPRRPLTLGEGWLRKGMRSRGVFQPRLKLEVLEDRTLLAASFLADPVQSDRFILQLTEDVPGSVDLLRLRNNGSYLEYSLNDAPFTPDLNSFVPGIQPLTLANISRADVSLGAGNDKLLL